MGLIIDTGKKNTSVSQKRKYGNLLIETSIKQSNNSNIILGTPQSINENTSNTNNNNTSRNSINQNSQNHVNKNVSSSICHNTPSASNTVDKKLRNSINTSISTIMKKGQKLSLTQKTPNLSKLMIGLEWDTNSKANSILDIDASIFMVDKNNTTLEENFIFYNNPKSRCSGILLNGDHNSNLKKAFNETVQLNLNLIPLHIHKLAITITIDDADIKNQRFGQISNGHFVIIDALSKKEILSYNFNENLSIETAVVVAEIYRYKDDWKINTIGSGFRGGLDALCDNYGIETE